MKKIHEQFSSIDLLNYLYTKIRFLFDAQRYVIAVLAEALRRSRMVALLGREGMGKSSAISKFLNENKNVFYVRLGVTYSISNLFDEMIFQVTGVYPAIHETLFTKMKTLSHALTKDNAKKLIIIDDAGRLSPRGLGVFIELRDNCIQCCGFVFVGLDYFQKNLLQAKKNGVPGVAEFYRRVENWYSIPGIKKNEVPAYGLEFKLNEDQVLDLQQAGCETIAELENTAQAILEEASDAENEERETRKVKVPGQRTEPTTKAEAKKLAREIVKGIDGKDDAAEREDDEYEDALELKKKEAARKARAAKKAKEKMKTKTATKVAASA